MLSRGKQKPRHFSFMVLRTVLSANRLMFNRENLPFPHPLVRKDLF